MSILDDAIREHLELKRAHGADESELKKLEDEAFGPPGRPQEPDPFAEAPTQFMPTEAPEGAEPAEEEGGRRINVADLQEPPPPGAAERPEEPRVEAVPTVEAEAEAEPVAPAEDPAQAASPAEEEPAMEHEVIAEPAAEPEPDEGRRAIAEQPTELFDVEAEMGSEAAPAEAPSPSDEQIVEAGREEPRLVPAADEEEDEEDEEFWSEQRLSDELDQALESPLSAEDELPPATEEHEAPGPAAPVPEDEGSEESHTDYDPDTGHEDVLEDTPEFLEESPEDDELWFEQKPPKDFDFDD
ncbi:MAG TPA: hypothetical protein VFK14_02665 [Solirubrobacterales bacterium]|nr:hypothetical protein [Solirubrobacterales bacterium]